MKNIIQQTHTSIDTNAYFIHPNDYAIRCLRYRHRQLDKHVCACVSERVQPVRGDASHPTWTLLYLHASRIIVCGFVHGIDFIAPAVCMFVTMVSLNILLKETIFDFNRRPLCHLKDRSDRGESATFRASNSAPVFRCDAYAMIKGANSELRRNLLRFEIS